MRTAKHVQSSWAGQLVAKQLLRSGTSVGANVTEAQAAQSRADFIYKMSIAHKEACETLYWLRLLVASKLVTASRLEALQQEADEICRIIATILKKTKTGASPP